MVFFVALNAATCVLLSAGREGRGDSLSPEWHSLHRRRAGPLPPVCTAGLPPALQQRAGHLCLVNTHAHAHGFCLSISKSQRLLLKCNTEQESSRGCVMIILPSAVCFDFLHWSHSANLYKENISRCGCEDHGHFFFYAGSKKCCHADLWIKFAPWRLKVRAPQPYQLFFPLFCIFEA